MTILLRHAPGVGSIQFFCLRLDVHGSAQLHISALRWLLHLVWHSALLPERSVRPRGTYSHLDGAEASPVIHRL